MSLQQTAILGAVGAAAIYAGRSLGIAKPILSADSKLTVTVVPIPSIAAQGGFSLEWVLIPAAIAVFLSN